jgi:MFS transporter, DHA1 family, multidrug resistance protein
MMNSPPKPVPVWLTALVIGHLAFGLLTMTISLPSMLEWPRVFGTSQAAVQLTFSGFVAAYGGLQLVHGPLSDRIGRKPVLLIGLATALAGLLLAAVAQSLGVLVLARVLQGAGSAAGMVVGRALVQDLFRGPERTRVMAFVGMTMGLCPPAATLVGGWVHVNWGWRANFLLMAGFAALLMVAAWRGLPDGRPQPGSASTVRDLLAGYARLTRMPAFVASVALLAATTATFYTYLAGAPLVLAAYGVRPDQIGWYLMTPPLAYILGNLLTVRLVRTRSDRTIMWMGQGLTLGGLVVASLVAAFLPAGPLALALPLLLLGLGHGLLVPPALVATVGLVPALAGSAAAVAGLLQQAGGAVAGYAVGWLPRPDALSLSLMMVAWTTLGALALARLSRSTPQPSPS